MVSLRNMAVGLFLAASADTSLAQETQPLDLSLAQEPVSDPVTIEPPEMKIVEEQVPNLTCTNDGNGAFSFYMDTYKEPIIKILESDYSWDSNHAVLVHMPEKLPSIFPTKLAERTDVVLSEAFNQNFEDFEGRFLMFFDPDREEGIDCSIEEHLNIINTQVRYFASFRHTVAPSASAETRPIIAAP